MKWTVGQRGGLTLDLGAVLSNDPERASEDLARLDVADRLKQLLGDGVTQRRELLHDLSKADRQRAREECRQAWQSDGPDEGDDIDGGRVAGVADELHEDVDDRSGDLGEADRACVDRLDEELAVLQVLHNQMLRVRICHERRRASDGRRTFS